jgi:hypothetical protein
VGGWMGGFDAIKLAHYGAGGRRTEGFRHRHCFMDSSVCKQEHW